MANFEQVQKNLEARRYKVKVFASAAEAADYLDAQIDGATVGLGGSGTLNAMGIYERLETHNTVFWHWKQPADEARRAAMQTQVYLTSANALAETGEIINIDGVGNRLAGTCSAMRRCTSSSAGTSWRRTMRRPSGGPGTWPAPTAPSSWGRRPPAPSRRIGAMTARARTGSATPW